MRSKLVLLVLFFALLTSLYSFGEAKQTSSELEQIVAIMDEHEIEMSSWQLYTRGVTATVTDFDDYKQQLERLTSKAEGFDLQTDMRTQKDEHWKVTAVYEHEHTDIKEKLTVLAYPQRDEYAAYVIHEVTGSSWDNQRDDDEIDVLNRVDRLFPTESETFVTVRGAMAEPQANLADDAHALIERFQAENVEELIEETFVSVSAYHNEWEAFIDSRGNKINLQVALRQSSDVGDGGTIVTIGTPIITTEY
ncbi:YwmB family TATA-box binding protein [Desertibacillus haloalkaliphilus]|uniref:YwmB family TATA-box binding protein n=1 Tax=Desertibacillus haloalkaliphilus TaxID=1328930 RepID=UPI001C2775D6|nr:YwmB family TATA-box binding protein [Desertibacillus haloalkaliphilus]MBU8905904.1 YwmB family TATA-box binding protein [Desertibacillus haloalkaliphilus]